MSGPILALRAAILSRCADDAGLAAALGGVATIHDEPPRGASPVYAVFGACTARDVSATGGDPLTEHDLTILCWARPGSAASALRAADRIAALLDDAPLALAGHRLCVIRHEDTDVRRDPDTTTIRARIRFRALTEQIGA